MTPRTYSSPEAFKQALEQRLRSAAKTGTEFARRRQILVFDRFLARIMAVLGDFMAFEIRPDDEHPEIKNEGMQYDGLRFRAECRLAGKLYGQSFSVDIAFGDPMVGEPEVVEAEDVLAFAGIAPPRLRLYPVETHIAEKLHAYTLPRARPNSRVKDLPDLALLATAQAIDARRLRAALDQTFNFRKTHPLPTSLPAPPPAWERPYAAMAREDRLLWATLDDVTKAARAFLDPVLAGVFDAQWSPADWAWGNTLR